MIGKKGKKRGVAKAGISVKRSRSRTKNEAMIARSSGRELNRQQFSGKSLHQYGSKGNLHQKSIDSNKEEQEPEKDARKVPILLREPGNTFQDEEDSEDELEKEELRVSQLIFSKNTGLQLSQQLKQSELEHAARIKSPSSSEDEEDGGYLISKALDSVTKSTNKNLIESMGNSGEGFAVKKSKKADYDTSSKGSGSNRKR